MADVWYYSVEGKPVGPHTLEDMLQLVHDGKLKPTDQICSDGQTWRTVANTPELQLAAASTTPSLVGYQARTTTDTIITPRAADMIRQTGLWTRIMSILMFISSGLMVGIGIVMTVVLLLLPSRGGEAPPAALGLLYVAMGALYFVPAFYLFRFASRAKSFFNLRHERLLEEALAAQKSFWKFVAILSLVIIALYLIMIPIMLFAAFAFHKL